MALNQLREELELAVVKDRTDHVIGVWNDTILIWGGWRRCGGKFCDPTTVHCYLDGIWIKRRTRGEVPPPMAGPAGGIIGDQLFVACGYRAIRYLNEEDLFPKYGTTAVTDALYKLDLNQWTWSKMEPGGTKPLKCWRMASWVSGKRLFLFGGIDGDKIGGQTYPESLEILRDHVVRSNQLVYYDSATNNWYWPSTHGDIPPPRMCYAACVTNDTNSKSNLSESYAIVFGGKGINRWYNNIVILNLANMTWFKVSSNGLALSEDLGVWPEPRCSPTLTRVSDKTAVLYGGCNRVMRILGDCWMLDFEAVISGTNPENFWTRCLHHEGDKREFHRAVMEPSSGRLWIVGGTDLSIKLEKPAPPIRELTITSHQKLKVLAIESVSRHLEKYGEAITMLPEDLQRAITNKARNHIVT